jgi:hypothetical protein
MDGRTAAGRSFWAASGIWAGAKKLCDAQQELILL